MSVSEAQRFELHRALQNLLGDDVSHTLMEHLPPSGWGDLARMRDIIEMEKRIDSRLAFLENRLHSINNRLTLVITCGLTVGLALLAIQVQIMLSIANL